MQIPFPQTRYQGSKLKLLGWFLPIFQKISFSTVLDAFGGTSAVSYMFKRMGKKVTYNDLLMSNWYIGKALIENKSTQLALSGVESVFKGKNGHNYQYIIQNHFKDIYYTNEENKFLDITVQNIFQIENEYEKALYLFGLFQACIQKRPFNLFHRKNLYLRLTDVKRNFGNKKTWDTSFPELIVRAIKQANNAIFDNNQVNLALNLSILDIPLSEEGFDLVYLDPPYISEKGVGVDYRDFYHFLEGMCNYHNWEEIIDYESKHRRLKIIENDWTNPRKIDKVFEECIKKFQDSKIVISYRDPGTPNINILEEILHGYKDDISMYTKDYKYALTSPQKVTKEVLLIAE